MIHILGAGAMGCLWAAHLNHSKPISFVSTKHKNSTSTSFSLVKSDENLTTNHELPMLAHNEVSSPIDTLLVCTKSFAACSALLQLKSKLSSQTKIILFQNGLGSQHELINAFPENPVIAAVTTEGANRKSVSQITHAGKGTTKLGLLNPENFDNAYAEEAVDTCYQELAGSGLELSKDEDIWQALWTKLVVNCAINPFTALLDCPNGEVRFHSLFNALWSELKQELTSLMNSAGYPVTEKKLESLVFDVMEKTGNNISSMLQDARNSRQTEINDINGFAWRYLESHQQKHGVNKKLWESVNALGH